MRITDEQEQILLDLKEKLEEEIQCINSEEIRSNQAEVLLLIALQKYFEYR